jgi:hypothetical protein
MARHAGSDSSSPTTGRWLFRDKTMNAAVQRICTPEEAERAIQADRASH